MQYKFILLVFYYYSIFQYCLSINFCPVSDLINTKINGYNYYPYEFLHDDEKDQKYIFYDNNYTCEAISTPSKFTCLFEYKSCPITKQNIRDSIEKSSYWLSNDYMCTFSKYLVSDEKETINIYIFGGSVTIGDQSRGCICEAQNDGRCKYFHTKYEVFNSDEDKFPHSKSYVFSYQQYTTSCKWISYFKRGINSIFSANVNIYNLAQSGTDSSWAADMISNFFPNSDSTEHNYNIPIPSEKDIILIDYSINDASSTNPNITFIGIEKLVRNLLQLSASHHNTSPTIILLELFPYPRQCDYNSGMYAKSCVDFDYSNLYSKVAKHYRLPIWSMKDLTNSNYTEKYQFHIRNYLKFWHNQAGDIHPPWMVHLLYADLLLAILRNEVSNCFSSESTNSIAIDSYTNKFQLPAPLNEESYDTCNYQFPSLIDISAYNLVTGRPIIGSYITSNESSWNIIEENKHKIGWVSLFKNETDNFNNTSILFEFDNKTISSEIMRNNLFSIKIHFLKTYENAGIVSLYFCNKPVIHGNQIDSLWKHHISQAVIHTLNLNITDYCDFNYLSYNQIQLKIHHLRIKCNSETSLKCKVRKETQKFKLLKVSGCFIH